ncbi:glycosyltransferase family 1 protein [Mycobacterium manitobense]|uniref:Glycosyltransferase family 1 protein n=1 Tax=[Mycobacterium] manitobense TaxID=190147 RepID=A0A9X2YM78_9MYCO|nr:glycosyltransferase [[Mycobacterium] manitobense]MCV7170364.1 glycosyltransferase family 1 protein [[Mycobacterium] manitobense]
MSTVAIAAVGSRGDVAPLTGVGVRLRAAGHRVVVAAYTPFAALVTNCGLEFRDLPADFTPGADHADATSRETFAAVFGRRGVRDTGRLVLEALGDVPADVLLLPPLAELAGHPLAEAKGIPALGVRLQPLSATAAYPPSVLGAWSAGRRGNRFAADAGAWVVDHLYGGVVAGFRRDLGLPDIPARTLRRHRTDMRWPVLHGYSPTILPWPADWRPGLETVGYWWPPLDPGWQPPRVLTDFLSAGPAPVFVGLGSTVVTVPRARQLAEIITRALRQAGVRGVVQPGWAGLAVHGDDVLTIGEAPHEWLLPQMSAVVQHCGAGTTAAALRAGVPTIAVPGPVGDQPFWARRLAELGASAATIPQRTLTADNLAEAIRMAVNNHELRRTTARLADRIAGEDGAARVVAVVESLLDPSTHQENTWPQIRNSSERSSPQEHSPEAGS